MGELLSRVEAILQNILGADNILVPPQSRVEAILIAILNNTEYIHPGDPSRVEEILLAIKDGGSYNKKALSRVEDILIHKLNDEEYTDYSEDDLSRVEKLLIQWIDLHPEVIKELTTSSLPISILANGLPLLDYTIYGNSVQNGTPTPDSPIEPEFVGERTENLLEIIPEMKNKDNWHVTPMYSYFMYYHLSDSVANELRKTGNIAGKVFLRAGGSYYNRLVFIITPTEIPTGVGNEFHLLTAGNALNYQKDVSEYENIYLGIGYGLGITSDNKQTLIDALFDNWDIMLVSGTTVPTSYQPYGYKIPVLSGGVNLFDPENGEQGSIGYAGNIGKGRPNGWVSDYIDVSGYSEVVLTQDRLTNTSLTDQYMTIGCWDENKNWIANSRSYKYVDSERPTATISLVKTLPSGTKYVRCGVLMNNIGDSPTTVHAMLNYDSTALPYEPYVTPTVKNIYLGQVQTTRRIKKLVLTGEETVTLQSTNVFFIRFAGQPNSKSSTIGISNQYQSAESIAVLYARDFSYQNDSGYYRIRIHDSRFETPEDFKSYLAAQYAAGTPVTVWYVLAESEIGIVNEPLCRIGDYADSVTFEQAGVEIPTLKKPNTTVIDVETSLEPFSIYLKYSEPSDGPAPKTPVLGTKDREIYVTSSNEVYVLRR